MKSDEPEDRICIKLAETEEEKQRIYAFRYSIYVDELQKNQLSSADHRNKIVRDKLDEHGLLFYAEVNGEIVATLRANIASNEIITDYLLENYALAPFLEKFDLSSISFTSRLMVSRHKRGSSVLAQLLGHSYRYGLEHGLRLDFCHCQPSLLPLYKHLGYKRYTDNFVDQETGYRIPMVLVIRDVEYMRTAHSPLVRIIRNFDALPADTDASSWLRKKYPLATQEATHWLLGEHSYWQYLAEKLAPLPEHALRLFQGLDEDEVKIVLKESPTIKARPGDPIIRAGDLGDEMFLLLSGFVDVWKDENLMATFEPGEVFGELSFVAKVVNHLKPIRSADVVAASDCEVLVITQSVINKLTKRAPQVAVRIAFNLASILGERMLTSTVPDKQSGNSEEGTSSA